MAISIPKQITARVGTCSNCECGLFEDRGVLFHQRHGYVFCEDVDPYTCKPPHPERRAEMRTTDYVTKMLERRLITNTEAQAMLAYREPPPLENFEVETGTVRERRHINIPIEQMAWPPPAVAIAEAETIRRRNLDTRVHTGALIRHQTALERLERASEEVEDVAAYNRRLVGEIKPKGRSRPTLTYRFVRRFVRPFMSNRAWLTFAAKHC